MKYQRQVERAFSRMCCESIQDRAVKQIKSAVVLHLDTAWVHIKHHTKYLVRLLCPICGHRHFVNHYNKKYDGWEIHCVYGWMRSILMLPKSTWFHLFQGWD